MNTEEKKKMLALEALCHNLIDHLDYCGWGDKWEREVSEDLRKEANAWQQENPK